MTPGGSSLPAYKLHQGSGQAYVYYRGRHHYFGARDAPESRVRYAGFITELAARPKGNSLLPAPFCLRGGTSCVAAGDGGVSRVKPAGPLWAHPRRR